MFVIVRTRARRPAYRPAESRPAMLVLGGLMAVVLWPLALAALDVWLVVTAVRMSRDR